MERPLYIYVDVDDTFVRSFSSKRIPIPSVIEHVKQLKKDGAQLYCWSSGGADYAKESAQEFDIADCFIGFLPKPMVVIDDVSLSKQMIEIHPNECPRKSVNIYRKEIF